MSFALAIIHVVICFLLIMIVLLQTGRGADIGAAFGGGSSQTLFGSAGPGGFLTKITTGVAIIFMITSISLAYVSSHKTGSSIIKETQPKKTVPAPPPVPVEKGTPITPAQPPAK
ncbi:MAG: preprotein translocase subunit SecG [Thermodesulfobacteriota bacterium]